MGDQTRRSDEAVLAEIGKRLALHRLELNWTQAQLAKEAGVSRRTLVRLEAGESTQLTNLIRVARALGLLERLDSLLPPPTPSPLEQLRHEGKRRKRASRTLNSKAAGEAWTWADPDQENGGDA